MTDQPGDLNLPFEHNPSPFESTLGHDASLSGGVVVLAIAAPIEGGGTMPGLVFRFAKPDGSGFYPDTALVCPAADLDGIVELVRHATAAAIRAAC